MSLKQKHPHIACYDIADPMRLTKVHRYLRRIGMPLQYSVFLLYINSEERKRITSGLLKIINVREDDVRIYPLPQRPDWQWWGRPLLPDGIQLTGLPLPEGMNVTKL